MPYYIKTGAIGCDGWATIKEDGEIIGCHTSKDAAIAQMVAVSLAEGMEPGGEMNDAPEHETRIEEPQTMNDEKRGIDDTEEMYTWTPRQKKLYEDLEDVAELFGKFGKGIDSEGAHYVEQSPFIDENLQCSSCAFFEGPRACEIVEGDIAPEAICKFWVIPNELLPIAEVPVEIMRTKDRSEEIRKSLPEVEKRSFNQDFEVRELPNGGFQFTGYAAVFNSDSEPLPFIERILPGAFDKTLKSRNNVKMYLNHDSTLVLGATRSKTLRLSTDTVGLLAQADLPNTSYARDLAEVMMRGDVDSMSFGFSVPRYGDTWSEDGMRRDLREIRLHEVSVVTGFPAYSATSASLRSVDALASVVGVDADQLAEALTVLENGKELSAEHAGLLTEAVAKLRADRVAPSSLNLKKMHLELLKKQF